jgi:uncharacterized protein
MSRFRAVAAAAVLPLIFAASASAHARISPPVTTANQLQLFSLAVPTEQANATTTKIVMNVPAGFSIDSFVPSPGWAMTLKQTGSGNNAVIQQVTWTGGRVPTGDDSLFQFLGEAMATGSYKFTVQQTYSNGQIVDWAGSESSAYPGPTIELKSSLGGGSVSVLTIIALVVGVLGLAAGGFALASGGGRRGGGGGGRPLA